MKKETYVETLYSQVQEYVEALNKQCERQELSNVYTLEIKDGTAPLSTGSETIKNYKTMEFRLDSNEGSFLLYIAHAPVKNHIEASTNKKWLLSLLRDFIYQCFTNYAVMSQATIIENERRKKEAEKPLKQVGSMVGLDGRPLMVKGK